MCTLRCRTNRDIGADDMEVFDAGHWQRIASELGAKVDHHLTLRNTSHSNTDLCGFLSAHLQVVVVLSGSMEPGFYRGDILFLNLGKKPFQTGEIVVFNLDGRAIPIVHRIIKVHERRDEDHFDVLTKVELRMLQACLLCSVDVHADVRAATSTCARMARYKAGHAAAVAHARHARPARCLVGRPSSSPSTS